MTPRCKPSAAIRAGECCFWVWGPAWAPQWSSAEPWCRWSWRRPAVPQGQDIRGLRGAPRARATRQEDGAGPWPTSLRGSKTAMGANYVVLGGGNAKRIRSLPVDTRLGNNNNAFLGGFRLWDADVSIASPSHPSYGELRRKKESVEGSDDGRDSLVGAMVHKGIVPCAAVS